VLFEVVSKGLENRMRVASRVQGLLQFVLKPVDGQANTSDGFLGDVFRSA
jgi:hypothetical protein